MIGGLRKKIALGLACCMLLGTIPVNASAAKTAGDVPPVQSDAKNASAVEEAKEGDLLYFVDVEVLVNDQSIGTAQIANLSTGVVKGVVKAEEASKLVVNSQSADSTVQVCYIKIYKGEGTDPVPPKPTFDPAVVDNAQVGDLLYFVDAGDYNTSTVADGEKLGILNSKTDQLYGTDDKEGYGWGLVSLDNEKHDTLLELSLIHISEPTRH